MREIAPMTPAVEVRTTFIPSERLRDALVDFLDPNLDPQTKESLRAAFLFRSFYRRVIERQNYYRRERDGSVYRASARFAALPRIPVLLNGVVDIAESRLTSRVVVQARQSQRSNTVTESYDLLRHIPAAFDERFDTIEEERKRFFVDIDKRKMGSHDEVASARDRLHTFATHPATAPRYHITADQIVIRNTMAHIPTLFNSEDD
ncbi:hypothetical protein H7X69_01000 [Candidatus Saccharibacteria bacterium]|nr:hypothetical protein [Candidatus Saccharibacteria bacterium]